MKNHNNTSSFGIAVSLSIFAICPTTPAQPKVPSKPPIVVPGQSIGRVHLGNTPAQVRKALGKPDKTLRLRGGYTDDIFVSKKTRLREGEAVRDKLEVLYLGGHVVQIEATSPRFATNSGLSTGSSVAKLTGGETPWRVLVYSYEEGDGAWQNYYLMDEKRGLTFEFEGWQENLMRRSLPTTIIVHRAGRRPQPDAGGELVTDSTDLSVVMSGDN